MPTEARTQRTSVMPTGAWEKPVDRSKSSRQHEGAARRSCSASNVLMTRPQGRGGTQEAVMGHTHGHEHGHHHHDREAAGAPLPAAFDTSVPDEALTPEQQSRRSMLRRAGLLGAGPPPHGVLAGAATPAYASTGGRMERRLPVAGRGSPHPHPVQQRRQVPRPRPGPAGRGARSGLDGHHRPRKRDARQDRRGQGQPGHPGGPGRLRGHPRLPGPGVEHPGRRARHRVRPPGPQRGRGPQAVRDRLRRQRQERLRLDARQRGARHRGPQLPFRAGPAAPRQGHPDAGQPPRPQGPRLPARDPCLARRDALPPDRRRLRGRAWSPGRRYREDVRHGCRARSVRQQPERQLLRRLPAGELPHLGRLRLDDRHRRGPVGQPPRRGQALVDHRQLRLPPGLHRHRRTRRTGQRLHRQRPATPTRSTAAGSTSRRATTGPASTAVRTSAPTDSRTPP